MAKITLTRALVELKTLEGRINNSLNNTLFCAVLKGKGNNQTVQNISMTPEALTARIRSDVQSLDDLIVRRDTIKQRLVEANAATKVLIAGKEYTIAGAIEAKRNVAFKQNLVNAMRTNLARAEQLIQQGNAKLNDDIEKAVATAYNGDKTKPSQEMYDAVANPRRATQELSLLDPVGVRAKLEALDKDLVSFLAEVDVALSEVNARTEVEV